MIPPVRMEPSVPSAVPSREALALLRILVVAGEGGSAGGLLQNLRQWADDGRLEIDTAPDLPRAVRQLSGQRWDVVLAVLGEHPDDDLSWWVDTLRAATGRDRKSTRLNSSHVRISYAVFCLKKKRTST